MRSERIYLDIIQLPIYASFLMEMLFLVLGHGLKKYLGDAWNRLDAVIVLGSILDLATYYTIDVGNEDTPFLAVVLTALRTLRAMRPLRLLSRLRYSVYLLYWYKRTNTDAQIYIRTLRRLGATLAKVLWTLSSAMSLFVAFIYVAAVLMLQFVSGKLSQCSDPSKH